MKKIPVRGIKSIKKLFHNELVKVYPTTLDLNSIKFWPENNRTIFTFHLLERKTGKTLKDISLEEITRFVAKQKIHKLSQLADSIERNGVQVPLIIRDDKKLLDGNRRFFACHWSKIRALDRGLSIPKGISKVPVFLIRKEDLDKEKTLELKILAEENFIPDLKLPWSLDAQARAVNSYYASVLKEKKGDEESALTEVCAVFGIKKQRARDLLETLALTEDFIAKGKSQDENDALRAVTEESFVYFWEFLNKGMKGKGALTEGLSEVRNLFFSFMAKGSESPFTNVKQVEPFIQAKQDRMAWKILCDSNGSKLPSVVSMVNERKEIRAAEDRVRLFISWLEDEKALSAEAKALLKKLSLLADKRAR